MKKNSDIRDLVLKSKNENEDTFFNYILTNLEDGLFKSIKVQVLFSYRLIFEMYINEIFSDLAVDIKQDANAYFGENKKNINVNYVTWKILENNKIILSDDAKVNKKIKFYLKMGVEKFLNDGAHYNRVNALVNDSIDNTEIKPILITCIFCLNFLIDNKFKLDDKFIKGIDEFVEKNNFFNQQSYINHGNYINTSRMDLLNFIKSHDTFSIPYYQRGYVWNEKQIETFLSSTESYKGSLTVRVENKIYKVIDGQQRLVTLILAMELLFPKKKIRLDNTVNFSSDINNLKNDIEKLNKTKEIILNYFDTLSKDEKDLVCKNILNSYFILVDIKSDNMEISNFTYMNISSKEFEEFEKVRTNVISKSYNELNSYTESEKWIKTIESKFTGEYSRDDISVFWTIVGELIKGKNKTKKIVDNALKVLTKNEMILRLLFTYVKSFEWKFRLKGKVNLREMLVGFINENILGKINDPESICLIIICYVTFFGVTMTTFGITVPRESESKLSKKLSALKLLATDMANDQKRSVANKKAKKIINKFIDGISDDLNKLNSNDIEEINIVNVEEINFKTYFLSSILNLEKRKRLNSGIEKKLEELIDLLFKYEVLEKRSVAAKNKILNNSKYIYDKILKNANASNYGTIEELIESAKLTINEKLKQ